MSFFYEFQQLFMNSNKERTYNYDKKTALQKAANWCAYQERSQQEVRDKLYEWQMKTSEVEDIIASLIQENFLNEERFAFAYVSGKFKIKKWGKIKIKQGLKLKRVPDRIIKSALASIDEDEYLATLTELLAKKSDKEREKNKLKRQLKLLNYLYGKGYEKDLIFPLLKNNDLL
jgi:regulatory protein